ncbi:MAG: hypothetical protein AB1346_12010 [Thermodesulfobacteriota bacterium]
MPALALSFLSALLWFLPLPLSPAAAAPKGSPPVAMEKHVDPDGSFALYKPPGWRVESRAIEGGKAVAVTDPGGDSAVFLRIRKMRDPGEKAAAIASRTLKELRAGASGWTLEWARSTADRRRAVAEFRYAGARNVPMRGRYYFNAKYPDATAFGYVAPEKEIERIRPTLLSVISNFTILDPSARGKEAPPPRRAPGIAELPLEKRTAKDGSCSILAPKGWKLDAGKGQLLCVPPGDGIAGFIAAPVEFRGPSRLPYFQAPNVPGTIRSPYLPPADALILGMRAWGSRNHKVIERASDPGRAREASAFLKRGVDIEVASIAFDSRTGVPCRGYYDVTGFHPMPSGQWGINVIGIWAPQKELAGYLPTLARMAESYSVDRQFADKYVREGMEKVRRMARQTSEMVARNAGEIRESSMAAYRERQKSQEYIDYKRTGYIRGEQEWVSEAEGGALYKSDHWGLSREGERVVEGQEYNYYNFKGKNPRYNEIMTPVDISREVYESVHGK